jgi:hypothetical protein
VNVLVTVTESPKSTNLSVAAASLLVISVVIVMLHLGWGCDGVSGLNVESVCVGRALLLRQDQAGSGVEWPSLCGGGVAGLVRASAGERASGSVELEEACPGEQRRAVGFFCRGRGRWWWGRAGEVARGEVNGGLGSWDLVVEWC